MTGFGLAAQRLRMCVASVVVIGRRGLLGALVLCACGVCTCLSPDGASASNWASFGVNPGNTRFNASEAFLTSSDTSALQPGWTFGDPGSAYSEVEQPAVVNGVAYFGMRDGDLYAVHANTGKLIWSSDIQGPATVTPLVSAGRIYVSTGSGDVLALASNGTLVWETNVGAGAGSIAEANGLLFLSAQDGVHALDASSGAPVWTYATSGASFPAYGNGNVYVTTSGGLIDLAATTGRLVWSGGQNLGLISDPTYSNGNVYFWTMAGNANGYEEAVNGHTGKGVWFDPGVWFSGDLAVAKGVLYAVYGYNNPAPCTWSPNGPPEGNCGYPPSPNGNSVVAVDTTTGNPIWSDAGDWSIGPAVAGGVVYDEYVNAAGNTVFGGADANTGALLWQETSAGVGGTFTSLSATVADGNVLIANGASMADFQLPLQATALPMITYTTAAPTVGHVLTVSNGSWATSNSLSYTYQWETCATAATATCTAIAGATSKSYKARSGDAGSYVTAAVEASDVEQGTQALANPVGPVVP